MQTYQERTFDLAGVEGLSAKQIEVHLGLYAGYVKNVNRIQSDLAMYMKDLEANAVALSELKRRFGFEFNGMRLHEYYFEQFEPKAGEASALSDALAAQWGSVDAWKAEFTAVAKMRGIGWALLVRDTQTGGLMNIWVSDHELGHLGGQQILLALDVWEHAFMVDYLPSERGTYIDVFFKNLNWQIAEARFTV